MKKSLLLLLTFVGMSVTTHSSVLVSITGSGSVGTSTNAPTANVFASNEEDVNAGGSTVDSALGWRYDSASSKRDIAQSFYVSNSTTFDKITFKIGGANIPSSLQNNSAATFTLSIYKLSSASALPSEASAQLVSQQSGNFSNFATGMATSSGNITNTKYNYLTFDFENVLLSQAGYYAVVLSFTSTASGYNVAMAMNDNNNTTYTQGSGAINYNNTGWAGASDFYFYAQAVPEPRTAALVFGGVLLLTGSLWNRRCRQ